MPNWPLDTVRTPNLWERFALLFCRKHVKVVAGLQIIYKVYRGVTYTISSCTIREAAEDEEWQ